MPLSISKHPLVADSLRGLRDSSTAPEEFRALARNVITMLLYEATADLPVKHGKVRTPLAEADAIEIETEVVAIPVLRAGLGLLAPVLELLPRVSVGYVGLARDETTAVAPEGVKVLEERHPEVDIYTAALDERLDDRAYIVPGLGDFGDRLFGTGN